MRKIKMIPVLLLTAALAAGCSAKSSTEKTAQTEEEAAVSEQASPNSGAASPSSPLTAGEAGSIPQEKADLMLPVAEGLIRSYEEQGLGYDDQDPAAVWWTLYHISEAMNTAHDQKDLEVTGDQLAHVLKAAYPNLTGPPAIPEALSELVVLDTETAVYHFRHQPEPEGQLKISKATVVMGNLYEFTVHFSYPDGSTSDYTLNAQDYPAGEEALPFPFSFIHMQPTEYPCTDNC